MITFALPTSIDWMGDSSTHIQRRLGSFDRSIGLGPVDLGLCRNHPVDNFQEYCRLEDCLGKDIGLQSELDCRMLHLEVQVMFQGILAGLDRIVEMEHIGRLMEKLLVENMDNRLDFQFVLGRDRIAWLEGGPYPTEQISYAWKDV
jgi:hypothetical protein